ncbi:PAS domain S-box protein [Methanoregula sp.]|uniref:PAS domain S-box protein n=1 Tax=Methanoregula sp. TaxID=2052170 RepID=UPI003567036A
MEKESEQDRIKNLLKENPKGLTIEDVSKKLSLNRATAAKYLNSLMMTGQAELRELGRAKIFYLSQRLPLTNLLSLSSDLILILDRDLFIQEVNEPFLSFFNLEKDALKGKKIEHSGFAPWFTEEYMVSLEQALDGTEVSREVHFETGDNDRYFKMKLIPLVFEGGAHAVGMIFEDISEMKRYQLELEERIRERTVKLQTKVEQHKRAEDALRENDAVLRSMLDATPVGVGLLVNRVFKKVNNSLCTITGYSAEELTGQNTKLLYLDDSEYIRISNELYRPPGDTGVGMAESRIRRKDGTVIDVIMSLSPFDPQNPESGVTVTLLDMTDRKRAEEALKKANQQVALLTGITRHDILNKLTVLRGYMRYMKKQPVSESLTDIIKKEEAVADLIANLIIFTRDYKDVGVQPPGWIRVDGSIRMIQKSMDLGGISVHADTGGLEIYADPLMKKVFSNLINHSLRHGGPVSEIRITARDAGNCLTILYEDNGTGIAADEKESIFEREYGKNTGLGLFLAREILAITGITITETGDVGHGVRFEISIPERAYRFAET